MSNITKKPTRSNPPFYFYEGKGWLIDAKIKVGDCYKKLSRRWFATIKEARDAYQTEAERMQSAEPDRHCLSWEEFKDIFLDYRRTQIRGSSLCQEKIHIRAAFDPLFKGKDVHAVFKRELATKVQRTVQGMPLNRSGKNKTLALYRHMLDYAFKHEYLEEDADYRRCLSEISTIRSTEEDEVKHERTVLTEEQCDALLGVITDAKDKLFTKTMMETGLRIGEALALRVSDFDLDVRELRITRTVSRDEFGQDKEYNHTKTKLGVRSIPLKPAFALIVSSYFQAFGLRGDAFLFPSVEDFNRPMDGSAYRRRLFRYCKDAGLPKIGPHCFRHTFATLLSQKCYTDAQRQARAYVMGHSVAVDEGVYTAHNQLSTAKAMIIDVGGEE